MKEVLYKLAVFAAGLPLRCLALLMKVLELMWKFGRWLRGVRRCVQGPNVTLDTMDVDKLGPRIRITLNSGAPIVVHTSKGPWTLKDPGDWALCPPETEVSCGNWRAKLEDILPPPGSEPVLIPTGRIRE